MNKSKFKKLLYIDISLFLLGMIKYILYPYSFAPDELAKAISLYEEMLPLPDSFSVIIFVIAFLSIFPAYYYLFTECLSTIAVKHGLKRELAEILSTQTFIGSSALMENSPNVGVVEHRENVTSPGGTTEAALKIFMNNDRLKLLIDEAVSMAIERSRTLSK